VKKLRGMFAFAIWDDRNKSLFWPATVSESSPVYSQSRNSVIFASEIKALLADADLQAEVRPSMIDRFLTFDYLPGEETLFKTSTSSLLGILYLSAPEDPTSASTGISISSRRLQASNTRNPASCIFSKNRSPCT